MCEDNQLSRCLPRGDQDERRSIIITFNKPSAALVNVFTYEAERTYYFACEQNVY